MQPALILSRWFGAPMLLSVWVVLLVSALIAGEVRADPASDALARVTELSRQAERTSEALYAAQIDLEAKAAAQVAAEERSAADQAATGAASADVRRYQAAVDRVAVAEYTGARSDGLTAALIAGSPQQLIDRLAVQRVMAAQMSRAMADFRTASDRAAVAERISANSAAEARSASDAAAQVRAELSEKQNQLIGEIAVVEAQYAALTAEQRAALADPGPPPPPTATPAAPDDLAIVANPALPPGAATAVPPAGGAGVAVVQAALTRVGSPYSWGATGPDAFDCSGLIKWSFQQQGKSLPRSSQALAAGGQPVAVAELQPGDIVTFYSDASHAGIFIGDGMMVHASTYGTPVKIAPISSAPIYNARRY